MPKIRTVAVWTVAALVTFAMEVVGLDRAVRLRDQITRAPDCPSPALAVETPTELAVPAPALPPPPPSPAVRLLAVRGDAVVIEAGGRRHELPGYPPPRKDHQQGYLTAAVVAPAGDLVAIAGECPGASGVEIPKTPTCARVFVRLYRVADGGHVRDLKIDWDSDNDQRRPLAISFDERGERLAVLVRASWTDCMWGGEYAELFVYRVADGARVAHRSFRADEPELARDLTFQNGAVHVRYPDGGRHKVQVVRLPGLSSPRPSPSEREPSQGLPSPRPSPASGRGRN